jgi:hypothetical protein
MLLFHYFHIIAFRHFFFFIIIAYYLLLLLPLARHYALAAIALPPLRFRRYDC